MSTIQIITEVELTNSATGFKMERSESELETRLGRSLHRVDETPISSQATDPLAIDHVHVLLHTEEDGCEDSQATDFAEHANPLLTPFVPSSLVVATKPIPISRSPSVSRSRSRVRDVESNDFDALIKNQNKNGPTTGKMKRKKKKKAQKKSSLPAMEPAMKTVRGFTPTRVPSGGGGSEFSPDQFKRRDISVNTSLANSPFMRPLSRASSITGGISALRQQLDKLELEPVPGNPGVIRNKSKCRSKTPDSPGMTTGSGSASETEPPEMTSYEVPLEHDFVSQEIQQEEEMDPHSPHMVLDNMHRKMTAQDFEPLTCLGTGSFGTVHLVKQVASGKLFAQKIFRKASLSVQQTLIEQTKTERAILESINRHPFIVNLYYAFQDQEKLYLILEYAQGGELFTHVAAERMFPEDTAAFYMAETVLALEYLHGMGIVYRDLKPENCLLDAEGHLLLTDFGLSKVAVDGAERCTSILGTWDYMAPEVILGHAYDKVVDWWALGALGYDLLTGAPPFAAENHSKVQRKIVRCKVYLPYFMSADAKDLLTRFLRKEPRKRLGANMPKDMQAIKNHRFFRKIDWARLAKRELEPPIKPLITDPALAENFSTEFTSLALSPTVKSHASMPPWAAYEEESNPFGGFSFVASKSLLAMEGFLPTAMDEEDE